MKRKNFPVFLAFPLSVFLLFVSGGRSSVKNVPDDPDKIVIPEKLNETFQRSCKPCHWEGGKFKALYHVNFSKWDDYKPSQQIKRAEKICRELQGEDMPPESFRKSKPNLIPTDEQVDAICKWSSALRTNK